MLAPLLLLLTAHVSADSISAGSSTVRGSSIPVGTIHKQFVMEDSAGSHVLGSLTQELTRVTIGGRSGLLSVQTFDFGGKRSVDSSFADARSLRPILHRSHNASRVMVLDFDGVRVVGSVTPATGAAKPVDQATAVATFDSNVADLVYSALPLTAGYTASVATYVYEEGGLVWTDISVTATEPIAGETVWHVLAHTANRDAEYWIGRKSHVVVRSRYQIAPGRALRIERI